MGFTMGNIHLHSIIVKYNTLEILSADTDFYAYIGQERFFSTFEKLIHPNGRERFLSIISRKDTNPFVIDLVRLNNEAVMTYMSISYEGDTMAIELESVSELRDGQEIYSKLLEMNNELLGLHNDIIFTFDDEYKVIKFYTPDFRRCTKTYMLQDFVDEVRECINVDEQDKLDEMLASLKSKSGSFAYTFTGRLMNNFQPCKNSIVKGFFVSGVEHIDAVGYIHRTSNKSEATYTVEKDALTDTYSKREIANMARKTIEVDKQVNTAICIIDVDYFKRVNDQFGHMMGDIVLKEIASIIKTEVGNSGAVGRFGGDEFLVIFYDVDDMEHYRNKLRGIKNRVSTKFPKSDDGSTVCVTLSIGCAVYPTDADNYDDLFCLADFCLYRAKEKGRNRYIIYKTHMHGSLEQIKNYFNNNRRIDTRKDLAMGDVLCMIGDKHYGDDTYTPEMLVDDLVENLPIERIICLTGTPPRYRCMSGINLSPVETINECAQIMQSISRDDRAEGDVLVVDHIEVLKNISEEVYEVYNRMNVKSFVLIEFLDAEKKPSLISLEMTTTNVSWNRNQLYNYRTIARMFGEHVL